MVNALAPPPTTEQGLSNKMQSVEWNEQQETQQATPYLISCIKKTYKRKNKCDKGFEQHIPMHLISYKL